VWTRHFAASQQDATPAQCLVSGVNGPTARLHHAIKGVRGAQSSGANIVSFNKESFVSYEKEQGLNAPVGIRVAAAYVTALNYLLRRGSRQSVWVGDSSVVFWAERPCRLEESLYYMFNPSGGKEDDQGQLDMATSERVRVFLEALRQGRLRDVEPDIGAQFYMLGLAPNASRLSVRFWHQSTVGEFGERLRAHLADIAIEPLDEPPPAVWQILREVAVQGKAENVPPLLGGALMRSVLSGGKYPESLLAALLRRMHAEQGTARHARMAMIRGCLVRNHNQEVPMSLDSEKRDVPYLLGRLFAIFEKAQVDAMGGKEPNATIKDRYFGSASATPRAVFPVLFRLNQHHVSKGERGGYYTKLIGEVTEHLPAENLPTHMRLEEQGLFAIGYYHQRNAFFRKQDNN